MSLIFFSLLVLAVGPDGSPQPPPVAVKLNADECVRLALQKSPKVGEAQAKVKEYVARMKEIESTFYPKLVATTYLAPMYTVHGTAATMDVERQWKKPSDWGPYAHFEALLALPIYTFGQAEYGKEAASERAEVERVRLREAENILALEVRKFYYMRLFPMSLVPALGSASKIVAEAETKGKELYEEGGGEVTQADLSKLRYGATEVEKFKRMAAFGTELATSALKHTMGLGELDELQLADEMLPEADETLVDETLLAASLSEAAQNRPEWQEILHGKAAATAWSKSEMSSFWPILFVAGQAELNYAPTRDAAKNPYWYDPYNRLFGGVAIGLNFNSDPVKAVARSQVADATLEQVLALEKFAATGLPLQVKKAFIELKQAQELANLSKEGMDATKTWLVFSAAAYSTGTGEAQDVLEGLVAYLTSKQNYYNNLLAFHVAKAELGFAMGRR